MTVPSLGAQIVFEAILKSFVGIDYGHVQPAPKLQLENLRGKQKISFEDISPVEKQAVFNL